MTGTTAIGFVYDANGNATQRGGALYGFDIGNRMTHVHNTALYNYDGHGRRTQVRAAFDGWAFRVQVYGPSGQLLYGHHSVQGGTRYVYLGQQLVAEVSGSGAATYQYTDALGSVVARSSGTRTRYEPYGATAAGATPSLGFTGHVNDADTGLVYMQQRYYDPIAGRFLSVDPVTADSATGGHFGRFHYAENNPYRYKDPDGRVAIVAAIPPLLIAGAAHYVLPGREAREHSLATSLRPATQLVNRIVEAIRSSAADSSSPAGQGAGSGSIAEPAGKDLLAPGGKAIGEQGSSKDIRVLPGGPQEAQELFDKATKGGKVIDSPRYPGKLVELPDGGTVGLRPESKSGGPAIDVNVPGVPYDKIHFGGKQ